MVRPRPLPPKRRDDGRVGLAEAAEDRAELLGRNTDTGIGNRKAQPHRCGAGVGGGFERLNRERDFALVGELDRVAEQIDQNLS